MSKHLKRLNAPRALQIHRKEKKWAIRASPGPHRLEAALPLGMIVRDYLHLADTLDETRNIIGRGEILVDGVVRKDYKFPCGLMDVISIPKLNKNYRILYNTRGKLVLQPIEEEEAKWKLCRIENKTVVKGNKIQLNLHDGRNKLVEKDDYKTGDVIKLSFDGNKIEDIYKFEKGNISLIIGGTHIGEIATIEDIEIVRSSKPNLAKMKGKTDFITLKKYVFPIGRDIPSITLPEVKVQ